MEVKYLCKDRYIKHLPSTLVSYHLTNMRSGEVECWRYSPDRHFVALTTAEPCIVSPLIDVTLLNKAYGSAAVPKLLYQMMSKDQVTAYRAMNTLAQEMFRPEMVVEAVRYNIVPRLVKLMSGEEDFLCQSALSCIRILCTQPSGKLSVISNPCAIRVLRSLLRDSSPDVRCQAVLTVRTLALNYTGVHTLVQNGYIEVVMDLVNNFQHPVIVLRELLWLLGLLLDDGDSARTLAITCDALEIVAFFSHKDPEVRTAAAAVLAQLFHSSIGKMAAIRKNLLDIIKKKLQDPNEDFKGKLVTGLMLATTELDVRRAANDLSIMRDMLQILAEYDQVSTQLHISAVKVLTNLAELPDVRRKLKLFLGNILRLSCPDKEEIRRHINTLINTILWTP